MQGPGPHVIKEHSVEEGQSDKVEAVFFLVLIIFDMQMFYVSRLQAHL